MAQDVTMGKLKPAVIYTCDIDGNKKGALTIPCMFNPFEYTISKSNTFEEKETNDTETPMVEFKKAGPQELKLQLFFDTYTKKPPANNVALITNNLWKLMEKKSNEEAQGDDKVPPPWVAFHWGVFKFVSVITQMTQKYTLFAKDGTPVRATVDITFRQYKDLNDFGPQNPTSGGGPIERVMTVTAGDRLDTIAASVYGDATKWRHIAERNDIRNPMNIKPGLQLRIPSKKAIS